ncbi:MAG TPA: hypothetical protein VFK42_16905 [Acidimicrobiales bacterium]|jgi:hypothetical protein|nr:hypothetical protein [Acidimicrobiales bacterium]
MSRQPETKRLLVALAAGWFVHAEVLALLQWCDVFGNDDQPWQTVFLGNIVYATIIWAVPLLAGWLLYMWSVNAVATRWSQRERTAAVLLVLVAVLPPLALAQLTEAWSGVLFVTGYALVAGLAIHLVRERAQAQS